MISILDISVKCQILALAVDAFLLFDFYRSKKLPLRSTNVFGIFLKMGIFNLFMDMGSYYTLLNKDVLPPVINRLVHMLFLGSIEGLAVTLFLYVFYLYGTHKRLEKWRLFMFVAPVLIALFCSFIVPIYYQLDERGGYSYGPMVNIMYVSIFFYIIAIYFMLITMKKDKHANYRDIVEDMNAAKWTIAIGLGIWIIVAGLQALTKYWLISSIGNCLMILYIYLFFENPKRYADEEIGTLNHRAFHVMILELFASGKDFWVMNFTVDNRKQTQTNMGHDQLNMVLRTVAHHFGQILPEQYFFHMQADTISIIVTEEEQYHWLIQKAKDSNLIIPYRQGEVEVPYRVSVLECPKYAGTADEVFETIDYILHYTGRHDVDRIFEVDEKTIEDKHYRAQVLKLLTTAVENEAFDVVYQPIYCTEKKKYTSAEALVRLRDCGDLGFISPELFIPLAEEQGMIAEIGAIVFEKVCHFAAVSKLWDKGIHYIEVNLSGLQSVDPGLPEQLQEVMARYQIDPGFINLEITETAAVNGGKQLLSNMDMLRGMGCHFSMDDFGTGYSNLSQMANVQFELVKLDKSLIWPAFGDRPEMAMVILKSCIQMIHELGSHIVAEGVETEEQKQFLSEHGVKYLQGYYFSKPVSEQLFLEQLLQFS